MSAEGKVPAPAGPGGAFKNSRKSRIYGFRAASALTLATLAPLGLISIGEFEGIVACPPRGFRVPDGSRKTESGPAEARLSGSRRTRASAPPGRKKKKEKKTKLTPNRKFLLPGALFSDAAAETSPFPRSHQLGGGLSPSVACLIKPTLPVASDFLLRTCQSYRGFPGKPAPLCLPNSPQSFWEYWKSSLMGAGRLGLVKVTVIVFIVTFTN